LDLARRVDLAEMDFCALAARAGEPGGARQLRVGGGLALCGRPGSPLNKMLGLGLGVEVADADLDAVDAFYDESAEPAQIELCPLAPAALAGRLVARGFSLRGFENQLAWQVRPIGNEAPPLPADVEVVPVDTVDAYDTWVQIVASGFAAGEGEDRTADQGALRQIADVMRDFHHETMTHYLARLGGHVVGGGAVYVRDGVAGLAGTATLPSARGRGVQHAIVGRMLRDVVPLADLAMATTEPGSRSQRTFERFGFEVIYTRSVWVRPFATA
jgi:GNAT superfamily N-acetyltransferase